MNGSAAFDSPPTNVPFRILTEIDPKPTEWLWKLRIALGELGILDGDPESNKSSLLLDIAARVSTGRKMPDGSPGLKGGVVLLAGEDSIEKTVVPRLKAAGADLLNVAIPDKLLTIPADLGILEEIALRMRTKLVVIDPIMVFLGRDANNDQSVRQALTPLKEMAERLNVAVVMVRHLNKSGRRHFLYRGSGSIGIVAVTRTGLLVGKHPKDPDLRVLAHGKSNLGPKAPSLVFEPVGNDQGVVKIEWRGPCEFRADDLLGQRNGQANLIEEAKKLLLDLLAAGPVEQRIVKEKAMKAGLAYRTVERAKEALGVRSTRQGWGPGSTWLWTLPKVAEPDGNSHRTPHAEVGVLWSRNVKTAGLRGFSFRTRLWQ